MSTIKKGKILVVDDTPMILRIINDILKNDYDIIVTKCGEQAIKLANENIPDLILLDIIMPNISGFDVLKSLKSNLKTKNIHVILITGGNGENTEAEGYAAGATDYITKPFVPSVVKHKVDFIIEHVAIKRKLMKLALQNGEEIKT
ncbi:MAG: response regulator [Defluviitaleaceae bacterium]|nr:response regulator [Defluviitaleaceae bacterium]